MNDQAKISDNSKPDTLSSPLPAKGSFQPLSRCDTLAQAFRSTEFLERIQASAPQHVQPQRLLRTFIMAANRAPLLAQASVKSFVGACLTLSQVGFEANTPLGHAFLVPFKTKRWDAQAQKRVDIVEIQVIFGYQGLLDLTYRSGRVQGVHADVVWPGDKFSFEYGTDAHVRHQPMGAPRGGNVEPTYAYMHARISDGQAFEVMPWRDVLAIRDRSQAYRYAVGARDAAVQEGKRIPAAYTEAPWVRWPVPMGRKTAFRAGSKWIPKSVELASAIAIDEGQDRRTHMDFGSVLDADSVDGRPDYLSAAVEAVEAPDDGRFSDDRPPAKDATAGFTDRRQQGRTIEHDRQPDGPPAGQQSDQTAPPRDTAPPEFEAFLFDAFGDPMTDEPVTDPAQAARLLADYFAGIPAEKRADALEHNADTIETLREFPAAASWLKKIEDEPVPNTDWLAQVSVPSDKGKVQWSQWARNIQTALAAVPMHPPAAILAWIDHQQPAFRNAPPSPRMVAHKAVMEAAAARGAQTPKWLADLLVRPAAKPDHAQQTRNPAPPPADPAPPGQEPAQQPPGDAQPKPDTDAIWVENQIKNVLDFQAMPDALEARDRFYQLAQSRTVMTIMARLRRERPDLYAKGNAAFTTAIKDIERRIPGKPQGRVEDDPPPPEDQDDPGPDEAVF